MQRPFKFTWLTNSLAGDYQVAYISIDLRHQSGFLNISLLNTSQIKKKKKKKKKKKNEDPLNVT